jgi:hypothetical protein
LGRAQWDAEQVCAELRDYVVEHLDDGAAIVAIDETSFLGEGGGVGRSGETVLWPDKANRKLSGRSISRLHQLEGALLA